MPRPDWITALAAYAAEGGQARAAERIGVAESTLSQVLSGSYKASTARIERRVRGELMGATCECPVMGDVSTRMCQEVQERRREAIGNPHYLQAWLACRGRGRWQRQGPCVHFNAGGAPREPAAGTTPDSGD